MSVSSSENNEQSAEQERTTQNMGMGGAYDGDMPEMERPMDEPESGNSAHNPNDAAMDTGRPPTSEKGKDVKEGEGAGTSYDYEADPKIAGSQERDPDMDTGNHARDVERDMTSRSEPNESGGERNPELENDVTSPSGQGNSEQGSGRPGMNSQDPEKETAGIP